MCRLGPGNLRFHIFRMFDSAKLPKIPVGNRVSPRYRIRPGKLSSIRQNIVLKFQLSFHEESVTRFRHPVNGHSITFIHWIDSCSVIYNRMVRPIKKTMTLLKLISITYLPSCAAHVSEDKDTRIEAAQHQYLWPSLLRLYWVATIHRNCRSCHKIGGRCRQENGCTC